MAAFQFCLVEFQRFFFRPFGGVSHVAFPRFLHAIDFAGRTTPDEYFPEETASFLVLQSVNGKDFLAVRFRQSENSLDVVEAFLELALVKKHHHIGVVDNGLFYDFAADDVLYLLCHHADTCPKLSCRLVHKLDVLGHEWRGDCLPCFLYYQDFSLLFQTHFLQEHVHDDKRDNRKKFLIFLDCIHFKDDKAL